MAQLTQLAQEIGLLKQSSAHCINISSILPPVTESLLDIVVTKPQGSLDVHDLINTDISQLSAQKLRLEETRKTRDPEAHQEILNNVNLVYTALKKVNRTTVHHVLEHRRLNRIAKSISITVKFLTVFVGMALLVEIDQRMGGAQVTNGLYYFAVGGSICAFVLLQVRDTWSFQERAAINRATAKALQALHQHVLYQMDADSLAPNDIDLIRTDLNTRYTLILGAAEGTFFEASLPPKE